MEMDTDDEVSQSIIPESPPISEPSTPIKQTREEHMDIEDDDSAEKFIEEFDSDTEATATTSKLKAVKDRGQGQPPLRCNFNVVIDIDQDSTDEDVPSGPPRVVPVDETPKQTPTTAPSDPDDPFASDEDDVVIMARVEQLEKSINEPNDPLTTGSPVPSSDLKELDLEEVEKKQKERMEEFQQLKRLSPTERIFPDVRPSNFHTVAFSIRPDYQAGDELLPHPQVFQSRWDPQFVPMPRDRENVRVFKIRQQKDIESGTADNPEEQRVGSPPTFVEKTVWMWQRIDQALKEPILTCQDISACLKHYCRAGSELRALNYAIEMIMSTSEREHFFTKVLPCMQTLCLEFSRIVTCPLPLLGKFVNYSISLTQKQIACLMANAFFSTFPKRLRDEMQFPSINFVELFQCLDEDDNSRLVTKGHKIRCILHYFSRIVDEMPQGVVTYTRRSIRNSKAPEWQNSTKKLTKIIPLSEGTIEDDGVGMLQVDFANKIIGGGVLGGGAVQEEILFVTYPELLISRLFTEKLTSCEALIVTGCERFSRYSGYARNFRFDGDFYDVTPIDSKGRKCTQIVAIDALYITKPITQFHPRFLTRELNKAFVGFSSPTATSVPVATGKWGCGAFNGNPQLKAILQLMSASQAGRDVVFFTFGDLVIQKEIEDMYSVIKDMTIQQVWNLLNQYYSLFCVSTLSKYSLCRFLKEFGCHPPPPQAGPSSQSSVQSEKLPGIKKLKEVPITKFYSKESKFKPPVNGEAGTASPEDDADYKNNWLGGKEMGLKKLSDATGHTKPNEQEGSLSDQQITLMLDEREETNSSRNSLPSTSVESQDSKIQMSVSIGSEDVSITSSNLENAKSPRPRHSNSKPISLAFTDFYK